MALVQMSGLMSWPMHQEVEKVELNWCRVLDRVIYVIELISERRLEVRSSDARTGCSPNDGNSRGISGLICEYDEVEVLQVSKQVM